MATIAAGNGLVSVVEMPMVVSPQVVYLQQLINSGFVGKVLSTTLIGSGGQWRDETIANLYYMYDKKNGPTLLTIPLPHALAGLIRVLGDFDQLTSRLASNYSTVKLRYRRSKA